MPGGDLHVGKCSSCGKKYDAKNGTTLTKRVWLVNLVGLMLVLLLVLGSLKRWF